VKRDTRRERLEHALRWCAACGEVFAPPMNVHHLCFAYWRAYGVQRCFYTHEGAKPDPARTPIYRQVPTIPNAMLAWLFHLHGVAESRGERVCGAPRRTDAVQRHPIVHLQSGGADTGARIRHARREAAPHRGRGSLIARVWVGHPCRH